MHSLMQFSVINLCLIMCRGRSAEDPDSSTQPSPSMFTSSTIVSTSTNRRSRSFVTSKPSNGSLDKQDKSIDALSQESNNNSVGSSSVEVGYTTSPASSSSVMGNGVDVSDNGNESNTMHGAGEGEVVDVDGGGTMTVDNPVKKKHKRRRIY